jgi:Rrf2 family protein
MKITAQEEYGLRCLLHLARHCDSQTPVTVREIAAQEGLSLAYVEKLLNRLTKAGLADSVRGVKGGFRFRGSPDEVTVGRAVRALGSFLTHAAICQRYTGEEERCVHNSDCGLRPVWSTLNYHLQRLLDNIPLSLLLQRERDARHQIMEMAPLPLTPSSRREARAGGVP